MKTRHTATLSTLILILLTSGQALAENQSVNESADPEDPPVVQHREDAQDRDERARPSSREQAAKTSKEAYKAARDAYRALVVAISAANEARLASRTQEGRDAWAKTLSDLNYARSDAWDAEQHAWDASQ